VVYDVDDKRSAERSRRTTYLSDLLGTPTVRSARSPLTPTEPAPRLLTWAFGLLAAAALVVCGLLMYDVVLGGVLSQPR
jgi:hypothetical protein